MVNMFTFVWIRYEFTGLITKGSYIRKRVIFVLLMYYTLYFNYKCANGEVVGGASPCARALRPPATHQCICIAAFRLAASPT